MKTKWSQHGVPRVQELYIPMIEALRQLGGSASIEEIDEKVAEILSLPEAARTELFNEGPRTKLAYRCAWTRSWLKHAGLVTNSERGVWALTPAGEAITEADFAGLADRVRQANYAVRRLRKAAEPERSEEEVEIAAEAEQEFDWKQRLLQALVTMPPDGFERLSQRILREAGFTRVEVTGRSGDGGIDGVGVLRVNLLSFHVLFQCKRWKGSVGAGTVRDFRGAMVGRSDKGLIITTGNFTPDARREATRDGAPAIDLVDGEALCALLKEYGLGVRVERVEKIDVDPAFFNSV